jgi:group I intron endonuclease
MYIGQSINVEKRLQSHRSMLRNGTHPNTRIAGAYRKYGDQLSFELVEACTEADLDAREQHWIDASDCPYNMSRVARSALSDPRVVAKAIKTFRERGHLARNAERMRAYHKDPEFSAKLKAIRSDSGVIAKRVLAIKAARSSPKSRAKTSEHAKKLWASAEHRALIASKLAAARARMTDDERSARAAATTARNTAVRATRLEAQGLAHATETELSTVRSDLRRAGDTTSERAKVVIIALNEIRRKRKNHE